MSNPNAPARRGPLGWLRLWFGLSERVDRRTYATTGFGLMAMKYGIDASIIWFATHRIWTPLEYMSPLHVTREAMLRTSPGVELVMGAFTLLFLWIGATMSVRRAADAGLSPWIGLFFFVPIANYVAMIALCFVPSSGGDEQGWSAAVPMPVLDAYYRSILLGLLLSTAIALSMLGIGVYVLKHYGTALFLGTPFVFGAVGAFVFNHGHPRGMKETLAISMLSVAVVGGALMLFALEGFICILMAAPFAVIGAFGGAIVGRAIALHGDTSRPILAGVIAGLPAVAGLGAIETPAPLFEVISVVEVDATPERVWANVVSFAELPEPRSGLFRIGIAYPVGARIEGRGVGAVRHCRFSTGPFVEPITAWDEPTRLAFDVAAQPPPMRELSPYAHVDAPHLDGAFRARRGEFRLIAMPGGRTRLEGSTWYELQIFPLAYWRPFADGIVRAIHDRVLQHVKSLSERT